MSHEWYVVAQPVADLGVPRRVELIRGWAIAAEFVQLFSGGTGHIAASPEFPQWKSYQGRLACAYATFLGKAEVYEGAIEERHAQAKIEAWKVPC